MPSAATSTTGAPPAQTRHLAFARYAWAVLAYNLAVVLWGAYVRATGSGAGCGNHWPLCNGEVAPHSPAIATIIEFTHRATSGLDLALVAALVVWGFRAFPRRHPVRLGVTLSAVFLITEALLGASLVLLEHVARNASAARAWSLSTHLLNTLTLLACLTLTAWWGMGRPPIRPRGKPAWMAAASLAVVMVLGVSGAIAALGDTLFPAPSLAAGFVQDFDPAANLFVRLRGLHPLVASFAAAWLVFYAVSAAPPSPDARRYSRALLMAVAGQLALGAANLLLLAPVWTQLLHLLLADLLWISLVLLAAARLAERTPE
ncbi:MAG: COX15/CtaA family protein [Acidobacteriia bacterium]|nr:COX15/CtaA family protein [Terriglobia bacterium]